MCVQTEMKETTVTKFKAGDVVKRFKNCHMGMCVGDTDVVKSVEGRNSVMLENYGGEHLARNLELVNSPYPNGKHKHHDLIVEWAKGAEIEVFLTGNDNGDGGTGGWYKTLTPSWTTTAVYRVEPQVDPKDVLREDLKKQLASIQKQLDDL